jgi:hypothetical protein
MLLEFIALAIEACGDAHASRSVIERRSDLHEVEVVILMAPLLAAFDSDLRE